MSFEHILLIVAGTIAGFIDSIAGGGGLINLPVLSTILGPGVHAIGTVKVVAFVMAIVAFWVYLKRHPLNLKKGFAFISMVTVGSLLGSLVAPFLPRIYFQYLLIFACPVILWFLWNKKNFIQEVQEHQAKTLTAMMAVGLLTGFYDGFFGPGGGTFYLLALLWGVRLSLLEALLLSKLANTMSAGIAAISYGVQGYIHWHEALIMSIGGLTGGFIGSKLASNRAEKIVRPILALVVVLLLIVQIQKL